MGAETDTDSWRLDAVRRARTVADTRLAYEAMAVRDMRDNRWTLVPLRLDMPRVPVRVALVSEPPGGKTSPAVAETVRRAGRRLAVAGHEVAECPAPEIEATIACWLELVSTELDAAAAVECAEPRRTPIHPRA